MFPPRGPRPILAPECTGSCTTGPTVMKLAILFNYCSFGTLFFLYTQQADLPSWTDGYGAVETTSSMVVMGCGNFYRNHVDHPSSSYIRHVYTEAKELFGEFIGSGNRITQMAPEPTATALHCTNEILWKPLSLSFINLHIFTIWRESSFSPAEKQMPSNLMQDMLSKVNVALLLILPHLVLTTEPTTHSNSSI